MVALTVVHAMQVGARRRAFRLAGPLPKKKLEDAVLRDCYGRCRRLQAFLSMRMQWTFLSVLNKRVKKYPRCPAVAKRRLLSAWAQLQRRAAREVRLFLRDFPAAPSRRKLDAVQHVQRHRLGNGGGTSEENMKNDEMLARHLHDEFKRRRFPQRRKKRA